MNSKLSFSLNDLKEVVQKHLLLDDYKIVDVICATFLANVFPADPLWLLIIGPSSTAKTELLNSIEGMPQAFFISDLTKSTLISGKPKASLLPHLNGKIIVMKDFTTVLSKKPDDLKVILSHLREICDGKLSKGFGTGDFEDKKNRLFEWKGHVGFIGACTAVYDRHYGVIGQMGERWLLYRTKNKDNMNTGIQALCGFGCENKMRAELKAAFTKFLVQFKKAKPIIPKQPPKDLAQKIVSLATFCGHGRCPVNRERYTKEITYLPDPEGTPRLSKQLYHLGIALKTIHQEDHITDEIYSIIKKIGADIIPKIRWKILRCLYKNRATEVNVKWMKTGEVSELTGIHGTTTLRALQDLSIIESVKGRLAEGEPGKTPYEWQIGEKALKWIGGSEIFEDLERNK
jgi:hypothetical protein